MNDTKDNSIMLNQLTRFLANNPKAIENILDIMDMIKNYANYLIIHDLRDALNNDEVLKKLIRQEKDINKKNICQRFWKKYTLVHDITNAEFGHFCLDIFYNESLMKWQINMKGRPPKHAKGYIEALKEKDPQKYKKTRICKHKPKDIKDYANSKEVPHISDFREDANNLIMNIDITYNKAKDVKELKKILKDIITKIYE